MMKEGHIVSCYSENYSVVANMSNKKAFKAALSWLNIFFFFLRFE